MLYSFDEILLAIKNNNGQIPVDMEEQMRKEIEDMDQAMIRFNDVMGSSRLSIKCKNCSHILTCENKKMEAFSYMDGLNSGSAIIDNPNIGVESRMPNLPGTVVIAIAGHNTTKFKDELIKEISKSIYSKLDINLGR